MAATNYYVDANIVTGDHDGSSWENAYASMSLAEAGLQKDLDAANEQMTIWCRSTAGTSDVTPVTITGWTTSIPDFLTIRAAATDKANAAGWSTSIYRLAIAGTAILDYEDYVRIYDLQISIDPAGAGQYCIGTATADPSDIRVGGCRLICLDTDGTYTSQGITAATNTTINIFNCIIYGFLHASSGFGINAATGAIAVTIYNCTIYNNLAGVYRTAGTVTITNSAVFKNTDDFYGTITKVKCASDDNDAENVAESGGGAEWPSDFVDAANGNFTLLSGSGLVNTGTDDPGTGLYSDDINGDARTSTWDIGADEYIAAAGGVSIPILMKHYRTLRST